MMDVTSRPELLPVLEELARLQACGRCGLRLAGVRSPAAYLAAPGTARALVEAVSAAAGLVDEAAGPSRKRKLSDDGDGSPTATARNAAEASALPAAADSEAPAGPCPLCLGALQALGACGTGTSALYSCELLTTTSNLHAPGSDPGSLPTITNQRKACPSLEAAAAAVAAEYELGPWALEVTVPAAVAVRAQVLTWHLKELLGVQEAVLLGATVGVKEAARLAYSSLLEQLLQQGQDPQAGLRIALTFTHEAAVDEAAWLAGGQQQHRKQGRGRGGSGRQRNGGTQSDPIQPAATDAVVQKLAAMPQEAFISACPASAARLEVPAGQMRVQVAPHRRAVHVGGRYLKLRRGIPQSPWFIDGHRKGESSVQEELAAAVVPPLLADAYSFSSAGREDIDVRMLGSGRPFILEVHNARRGTPSPEQCAAMEAAINTADRGVEARGLRPADAAVVARLREGEQEKEKSYSALCWLPRPLTQADVALLAGLGELELEQQTPVRVLHRRANMMRRRAVRDLRVKRLVEPGTPPTGQQQLAKPQQQQQLQQVKDEEVGIQRQQQQQQQQPQEASAVSLSAAAAAAAPPPQQQAGAGGASGAAAAGAGGAPGAAAAAGGATAAAGPGEYFELHMRTQAGTYVKEFVTGDLGRTNPSLGQLLGGCQAEIVALDVTEVHMDVL